MTTKFQFPIAAFVATVALIAATSSVRSQSQQPIVVQAASNVGTPSSAAAPAIANPPLSAPTSDAFVIAIRTLEQIKSANDEVLKRQQATLQQLEEMQQAAEELKIFSKRS